jgi:hypothetical protein
MRRHTLDYMLVGIICAGSMLALAWPLIHGATETLPKIAGSVLGPFFGAGFAFALNQGMQLRQRKKDRMGAGSLALFTLSVQLNDCALLRHGFHEQLAKNSAGRPFAPTWALASRFQYVFHESAKGFEYKDLAFLLDTTAGGEAVNRLREISRLYADTQDTFKKLDAAVERIQKDQSAAEKTNPEATYSQRAKALGPEVTQLVSSLMHNLLSSTERFPGRAETAFDMLDRELEERFGPPAWKPARVSTTWYAPGNLKPLPPLFARERVAG